MADLTGKNISDTYTRLVQVSESQLYDGAGGILPIQFDSENVIISGTLTAQTYVVSESIVNVSSGSTMFGNSSDDTHTFTGNITASNITASNLDLSDNINFKDTVAQIVTNGEAMFTFQQPNQQILAGMNIRTQDGNGIKFGVDSDYTIKHASTLTDEKRLLIAEGGSTRYVFGIGGHLTGSSHVNIELQGTGEFRGESTNTTNVTASNITASNIETTNIIATNITASGAISASVINGAGTGITQLNVEGQITASSTISASGDVKAFRYLIKEEAVLASDGTTLRIGLGEADKVNSYRGVSSFEGNITGSGNINTTGIYKVDDVNAIDYQSSTHLFGSNTSFTKLRSTVGVEITSPITASHNISASSLDVSTHITASGDISSSGTIFASNFRVPGQGRISFDHTETDDQFIKGLDNSIIIDADDRLQLRADDTIEIQDENDDITITIDPTGGHITASGIISASEYRGQTVSLLTHAFGVNRGNISPTFQAGHMISGNKTWAWSDRAWIGNFMFDPRDGNMSIMSQSHAFVMPFDVDNLNATVTYASNRHNSDGSVSGSFYLFKRIPSGQFEASSSVSLIPLGVNSELFNHNSNASRRCPTFNVSTSALLPSGNNNPISMSKGDELYFFYSDNTGQTGGNCRCNINISAEKV